MSALREEARLVLRDPMFRIACVLLLALTFAALWNGRQFQAARDAEAAAEVTRSIEKREKAIETLRQEAEGVVPANPWGASEPTRADWNATRPSGPLSALSFGREDIEPLSATVSLWMVREDNLFRKHEFGSPLVMSAGRFDAGFLVVLLLPLFILALTHGVVAEERESGRLRYALVQGSVAGRLALRLFLRASPVFGALALIGIVGSAWGLSADRLAWWLGGAALYLALWTALAALIATLRARQEVVALAGAGAWLALVVILPAIGVWLAQAAAPSPSAFAVINGARAASIEANRKLMENLEVYVSDHPELMSDPDESDWAAKLYVSQQVISEEIAPVMRRASEQAERQAWWTTRLRFLSPTGAVDDLLTEAAGTGRGRQAAYVDQTQTFLREWQARMSPLIFARTRLTADDYPSLPRFTFREPPIDVGRATASLALLTALAGVIGLLAVRAFGRLGKG